MGSRERKIYFQRMHRIGSHRRVFGVPLFVPSKLVELLALYLDSNRLTGQIPTSIGQLTSLLDLRLRANKLAGTLPTELGVLTNLEVCIRCMVCLLIDMLSFICSIIEPYPCLFHTYFIIMLKTLYLDTNSGITGKIPTELGNLAKATGEYLCV